MRKYLLWAINLSFHLGFPLFPSLLAMKQGSLLTTSGFSESRICLKTISISGRNLHVRQVLTPSPCSLAPATHRSTQKDYTWNKPKSVEEGLNKQKYVKFSICNFNFAFLFSSVSRVLLFATPLTAACQASLSTPSPRACSDSCSLSQWYHPTISSSVVPFSSCLQSFLALGSFPKSQFFTSGGQSIGSFSFSMNIQDWFPLGWTGWILLSKGLSRVFSNTTVQKHQFFSAQLSL